MFHKRKFTPIFPEKYTGDPTNIIMRSSWETMFASWCDKNPSIVKWSSEETIVPYRCPTDNNIHRYFVDFKIQVRSKESFLKTYLVEVKPQKQTVAPVYPGKQTQRYLTESLTFMKNKAKWAAAVEYAKDRGWEFKIITEHELGLTPK
jgi:CRISPR/Cas system CMR-associated protein Cmr5 small subunit